ncbi:hypothetical protein PGH07_01980 [Sulfurovum sp. zt1-1]|uniref:Uncharacterized protein n=1 Tax=Sulfurovum zhangzhouensis TaxID=3019067 RepID=A0ABT7QVX9_9BACT|nr:hypothetical protein [Sulfurovum zhangzhouensis]MDM5270943.1 hypothetical protein [Sulfurovum zhangzhouensis]
MVESGAKARRADLAFNETEIKLAVDMVDKLTTPMEVLYYLLEHRRLNSFVLILVSAENIDTHTILQNEKRDTDLLFCLGEEHGVHALLCQETKVDGGYMFAERIVKRLTLEKGTSIYCSVLEVRTTTYKIKDIIFRGLETYMKALHEEQIGEIIIKTIN